MKQTVTRCLGHVALLAVLGWLVPCPAAAVDYISSPPMSKLVTKNASDCGHAAETRVPLITWGGDIATVYANGNQKRTSSDSIFARQGLKLKLVREDVFSEQLLAYVACESPYLRGTMGMINMAAEVAARDSRTEMVPIYQMTWSAGGDALVVKEGIGGPKALKGKTVAVQAYGPHVDYMAKVLADAGLSIGDVNVKWVKDLVGFDGSTPTAAFHDDPNIDAAFVIIPDALALTSNGAVGTGAEDSVRGAKILLSTKTANRIIADTYVVRRDYLDANREEVESFVHGLMMANEELRDLVKNKKSRSKDYSSMISAAAEILLDSAHAVADAEGMYLDAEFVGWKGNVKFFGDTNYARSLKNLNSEIQPSFVGLTLLKSQHPMTHAKWDYNRLKRKLSDTSGVEAPRFDTSAVAKVVARKQKQGTLQEGELFSFEVYFRPNQKSFSADLYGEAFARVIDLASTYGGAIITVEGHSDPLGFLKAKKSGSPEVVQRRMKQAAKNLSLSRANAVRDNLIAFAQSKNTTLDATQFAVVGHGISKPTTGFCGQDPCPPKTEQEWLNNMRVEFRIIQMEAEASVFQPL